MLKDEDSVIYFKYEIKNYSGYRKVSEKSNIKSLVKIKIDGFKCYSETSKHVIFGLDSQLYRRIKLISLGNNGSRQDNFLEFMVSRSHKVTLNSNELLPDCWYSGNWYDYDYDYDIRENKQENRNRKRIHTNLCKQKYKMRK